MMIRFLFYTSIYSLNVFLGGVCRLVSGAGDIKLTKDGNVLLHEMVRGTLL